MSEARPARFPWWIYWLLLALILLFAFAPVISVMIAGWMAEANGCALDEGSIHTCMVGGEDIGPTLYTLFVLGWFGLATLPLGGGALIVWLVIVIIHRLAWGHWQKKANP